MQLTEQYDGSNDPFEGERIIELRSLPAGVQVTKAKITLTPVAPTDGTPFEEIIAFTNGQGNFGATKAKGTDFIEIDFHARRTLAAVKATNITGNTNLQVDVGGLYVEINDKGAIKSPSDTKLFSPTDGKLPGLTVSKFKLSPGNKLDISEVTIRSTPTNVNLRLGQMPPFWTRLGEMTQPETSPDFAAVLQAFLANAKVENGFYTIPFVIHSDTIARLNVEVKIEYVRQQSLLPEGLNEVSLPFNLSTVPQAKADTLQVALPPDARVVPRETTARVVGAFDETRIAFGPTGAVTPAAASEVSPASSQAQLISLDKAVAATAIDFLVAAVSRTARLQVDLRKDLDGKPDSASLLPKPVELALDREVAGQPTWVSALLPTEFHFEKFDAQSKKRYWLLLQSLEGEAAWSVEPATAGALGLQRTRDGGLSWRETTVSGVSGPVTSFFRLRTKPERFQVPIELQVGAGEKAKRVKLDRFEPLGRVNFALDFPEVADAFNNYLADSATSVCPEVDHIANGDFEKWIVVDNKIGTPRPIDLKDKSPIVVAVGPDGRTAYVASVEKNSNVVPNIALVGSTQTPYLQFVDVACDTLDAASKTLPREIKLNSFNSPNAIAVHPDGTRVYVLTGNQNLHLIDTSARKELGTPINLKGNIRSLAVTPNGRQLLVLDVTNTGTPSSKILSIDTDKLEQFVRDQTLFDKTKDASTFFDFKGNQEPTALAVAPDGSRLYVLFVANDQRTIHILDTAKPQPVDLGSPIILVGPDPRGIALTPDGAQLLVADGTSTSTKVTVVDLARRTVRSFDVTTPQSALAITPQGDRVYVVSEDKFSLVSITLGTQIPTEWALTSGVITPLCLNDPFHLVAVLGLPQPQKSTISALSQMVPAVASCPYDFSFWGLSVNEEGAIAEVSWVSNGCVPLRTDRVPLEKGEIDLAGEPLNLDTLIQDPDLVALKLHHKRLTAPEGATQAEVRFSVPEDLIAVIDKVSLCGTSELLGNTDLQLQENQQPADWRLSPENPPGFLVIPNEDPNIAEVQLRNGGPQTVELSQTVPVTAGQPFVLDFQGWRVIKPGAPKDNPTIELHWLKTDDTELEPTLALEISPTNFDHLAAEGTVPAEAIQAELRIVLPTGTTLAVKQISLKLSKPVPVPVSFVAQSKGELTVSNTKVVYDQPKPSPPPVPKEGLCSPSPPDECFCPCCETNRPMKNPVPAMTEAHRPATVGDCPKCGAKLVRHGGQLVPGARSLSSLVRRAAVPTPTMPGARPAGPKESLAQTMIGPATKPPSLTDIPGIAEARATRLRGSGIDSIEKLAVATPKDLVRVLKPITEKLVKQLIEEARRFVERK